MSDVFEVCSKYKRVGFDFDEIQRDRNNPLDSKGYPIYPILMPSNQGSSFTYKVGEDWFFKRKLQDGETPYSIFSQHHFNQAYNELYGTFDDLGEVLAYFLAKPIVDSKSGEPIVHIPEYKLATYTDKEGVLLRGCVSKNVCENENQKLISVSEIMRAAGNLDGKSIDVYMKAIEAYCKMKKIDCDFDLTRMQMVVDSYFNWKIANSDNHKNNVMFIVEKDANGKTRLFSKYMIDNGSSYELSTKYTNGDGRIRLEMLLNEDNYSRLCENGERVFEFSDYPYMHTAFQLEPENLLISNTKIGEKNYSYEYSLASEMLSNPETYRKIFEIENQFNLEGAIAEIDSIYGYPKNGTKEINWPPYLKDFMHATNKHKSRVLTFVVSDYYLKVAFETMIGKFDSEKYSALFAEFSAYMMQVPLLKSKEEYDRLFIAIAKKYDIEIDEKKLKSVKFKAEGELSNEQQPNDE